VTEERRLPLPVAWLGLLAVAFGSLWLAVDSFFDRSGCLVGLFAIAAVFFNVAFWWGVVKHVRQEGWARKALAVAAAIAWLAAAAYRVLPLLTMREIYDRPPVTVRADGPTARHGKPLSLDVRIRCTLKCALTRIEFRPAAGAERVLYASEGLPKTIYIRPGTRETASAKVRLLVERSDSPGLGALEIRYEEATRSGLGEFGVSDRSVTVPLRVEAEFHEEKVDGSG
jgi:hypothetical protein